METPSQRSGPMILRTDSGDKIVLPDMHAIESGGQAQIGAVIHDQACDGAPARRCLFNSLACSSIRRAFPDLLRYCRSVQPPAARASAKASSSEVVARHLNRRCNKDAEG